MERLLAYEMTNGRTYIGKTYRHVNVIAYLYDVKVLSTPGGLCIKKSRAEYYKEEYYKNDIKSMDKEILIRIDNMCARYTLEEIVEDEKN